MDSIYKKQLFEIVDMEANPICNYFTSRKSLDSSIAAHKKQDPDFGKKHTIVVYEVIASTTEEIDLPSGEELEVFETQLEKLMSEDSAESYERLCDLADSSDSLGYFHFCEYGDEDRTDAEDKQTLLSIIRGTYEYCEDCNATDHIEGSEACGVSYPAEAD